jgi:D-threo-aldose 1-dehydrogenase
MSPRLGFGCASLYGLPDKRSRRAILECAYDLGIRHFDVAPMYGLGLAEPELAAFVSTRPEVVLATKFGIGLKPLGRLAGHIQGPIRRMLRSSRRANSRVKESGRAPDAGLLGRALYTEKDYSVDTAKRALEASLRTLRTDKIDYFLLHEPASSSRTGFPRLADYLEGARAAGTIGRWGPAGDLSGLDTNSDDFMRGASVAQFPYDLFDGWPAHAPANGQYHITFGILAGALPRVQETLAQLPELRRVCSEMLDSDLADPRNVVGLLVRDAVTQNSDGTVLLSSTNMKNLEMACGAAGRAPFKNESRVAQMIRNGYVEMAPDR